MAAEPVGPDKPPLDGMKCRGAGQPRAMTRVTLVNALGRVLGSRQSSGRSFALAGVPVIHWAKQKLQVDGVHSIAFRLTRN
jgi:hypothetical protein